MHATMLVQIANGWAAAWGIALGRACGQGTLCVLLAWSVCRLWPRMPAASRAWLWWLSCLKLTVGLLCVAPVALPVLPHAPGPPPVFLSRLSPDLPVAFTGKVAPSPVNPMGAWRAKPVLVASQNEEEGTACQAPTPLAWLWLLWLAGVGLMLGRDVRQWLRLRRRLGHLPPSPSPRIVETDAVAGPLVTGLWRPVILLPRSTSLSDQERAMAVAHELAHLRRGDLWLGLLPSLAQALLFFFPPARWAVHEYHLAREEACDAEALRRTGAAPAQYARLLLRFASPLSPSPALGLGANYRALRRRLTTLPQASRHAPPTKRRVFAALALGALLVAPWQLTAATGKLTGPREAPLPDPATLRFALTDLGATDGNDSGATGINDRGQIVGCAENGERALFGRAVLWDGGRVHDLGPLPGDVYCRANGINDAGQVIASSYSRFDHNRAFVWQSGEKTELAGLDGYPHSKALNLNNVGQVVGYAQTGTHDPRRKLVARAALWSGAGGRPADLGTLGGDYSAAYGVNDRGMVVGKADTAFFGSTHAFLWQNGRMMDLGTLGGPNSLALRVNNQGIVVGYSETGSTTHAFLWQNGALRDLGTLPGASASEAHALNDRDQVVGASDDAATLWQAGKVVDLNRLVSAASGWTLEDATGINAQGQIVGRGTTPDGHVHAFLLTPAGKA